jgi:hypothetical protein
VFQPVPRIPSKFRAACVHFAYIGRLGGICFARPSAFTCSPLGEFCVRRSEVRPVLVVAVLPDLAPHVVEQVFRTVAAEPLAYAAIGSPTSNAVHSGPPLPGMAVAALDPNRANRLEIQR